MSVRRLRRCWPRSISRVTVYDARPELANREHFPTAKEILCAPFSEAMERVKLKPSDYVVIMTPGHQSDRELLSMVLRHKTRYVGCIGSRHKIARTQELLRAEGISEEAIRACIRPSASRFRRRLRPRSPSALRRS